MVQIEASNGDIKNFNPGGMLLAEDLTGKGHKTRNLHGEAVSYLAIPAAWELVLRSRITLR
ncbi:hypothetical protein [Legionella cherrii]|uniref:Uncharacterized protein n=1 Tax=Legionella cherrii TaxID=28084 RepID=A0ABY6T2F5_9GAMM|nr:hypothetical protein [Legionella cherrii]VEB32702.1 Uncharacterised protein [Legionella cherrii]